MTKAARWLMAVTALVLLGLANGGLAAAQQTPPLMKVDLIIPAGIEEDTRQVETDLCVMLPVEASVLTVTRRAFVPETGTDRPLWMTIRPYVSTANALVERTNIQGSMMLPLPELGYETCFFFGYAVPQAQAQSVAQAYKYYAQIATIEIR